MHKLWDVLYVNSSLYYGFRKWVTFTLRCLIRQVADNMPQSHTRMCYVTSCGLHRFLPTLYAKKYEASSSFVVLCLGLVPIHLIEINDGWFTAIAVIMKLSQYHWNTTDRGWYLRWKGIQKVTKLHEIYSIWCWKPTHLVSYFNADHWHWGNFKIGHISLNYMAK